MRTRQDETFDWGNGFALPRLISHPQEGSGEECGRVSDWGFSEIRRLQNQKPYYGNYIRKHKESASKTRINAG